MRRGAKPAKAKVEAKLPVAGKPLKNKSSGGRELEKRLAESLEQQTATTEILGVISRSPANAQPVFDAIAVNALRLCDAEGAVVVRYDGALLHLAAHHNVNPEAVERLGRQYPQAPDRHVPMSRAVLDGAVVHVPDLQAAVEFSGSVARQFGARSHVSIPLLHQGRAVGAIGISRGRLGPFSDRQIELLKTFAAQTVIAIENVRLFTELAASNRDLTVALDQQTATSEILRVISSSPTDVEPVFRTILANANTLCDASFSVLWLWDGEALTAVAHENVSRGLAEALRTARPRPHRRNPLALSILEQTVVHVADVLTDPRFAPDDVPTYRLEGARSIVSVPMVREGGLVGVINAWRREPRAFSDGQIELLKTFADQAVIAIENVRLFKELEARNSELTEALEQQTATSEILRVISSSPTDLHPVLNAVAERAARLCGANDAVIYSVDGNVRRQVAHFGSVPLSVAAEVRLSLGTVTGRAILERRTIHIRDMFEEFARGEYSESQQQRGPAFRTLLVTPLLREEVAVGAITVRRTEVRPFSDKQVDLLQTFADQAVIAIENVRLFNELQARTAELTRSVDELTALGEVSRTLSSTLDLETVLTTIVSRAVQLSGLDGGVVFEYDEAAEEFVQRAAAETGGVLAEARRGLRYRKGEGALGRTAITLEPVQVPDITVRGAYDSRVRENLIESGIRAILAVPMVRDDRLIGCLVVSRNRSGDFPAETIEMLRTFATQSALAIQNARLFREIEEKSQQLEIASQHKSEFLANMSHELRTPLNAIIGFSEVLSDRMFGELNEKQEEYLKDIHASGTHLLSLINDILDLSKIEAGRMELELTDFDLPQAIDSALTFVRERAARRGITLESTVDARLGQIQADERKFRQVVLNLLSNAIKFTPEGGRIEVGAVPKDGLVEVSVTDTGVGIAPEDQEAVFEEFRQVGTAEKKAEGTGLGLTLCRKFIELHGGKIRVSSQVGVGSTFTFTIPMRPST